MEKKRKKSIKRVMETRKTPLEQWFLNNGVYFAKRDAGRDDGFTQKEVLEIAPQVLDSAHESERYSFGRHVLVKSDGEEYYVSIDSTGVVTLPKLIGNGDLAVPGKTNDKKRILGFRDRILRY
jgi:hypothetical protein